MRSTEIHRGAKLCTSSHVYKHFRTVHGSLVEVRVSNLDEHFSHTRSTHNTTCTAVTVHVHTQAGFGRAGASLLGAILAYLHGLLSRPVDTFYIYTSVERCLIEV